MIAKCTAKRISRSQVIIACWTWLVLCLVDTVVCLGLEPATIRYVQKKTSATYEASFNHEINFQKTDKNA